MKITYLMLIFLCVTSCSPVKAAYLSNGSTFKANLELISGTENSPYDLTLRRLHRVFNDAETSITDRQRRFGLVSLFPDAQEEFWGDRMAETILPMSKDMATRLNGGIRIDDNKTLYFIRTEFIFIVTEKITLSLKSVNRGPALAFTRRF